MTKTGLSEENIPNSYYLEFGEGKYVGLDTDDTYTVKLQGLDTGTFTLIIEELMDDQVTGTITYADIPVTATTQASFTIQTIDTVTPLQIDIDGDGSTDFTLEEGEKVTPLTQLKIFKGIIKSLNIRSGIKNSLIEKIDPIIKLLKLGKTKGAMEMLTSFQNQLKALAGKKLPVETSVELIQIIETIKDTIWIIENIA